MNSQGFFSLAMSRMNCKTKSNFIFTLLLDLNVKFAEVIRKEFCQKQNSTLKEFNTVELEWKIIRRKIPFEELAENLSC